MYELTFELDFFKNKPYYKKFVSGMEEIAMVPCASKKISDNKYVSECQYDCENYFGMFTFEFFAHYLEHMEKSECRDFLRKLNIKAVKRDDAGNIIDSYSDIEAFIADQVG